MIDNKRIPITTVRLTWADPLLGPPKPHLMRGAFAHSFPSEPLFHQHTKDGFIYRYPLIQYRWQSGAGIIVGYHEGAKLLARVPFLDLSLRLGENIITVADAHINCHETEVSVSDSLLRYRFLTTNACLPESIAIGKAVSHGFGWLERLNEL